MPLFPFVEILSVFFAPPSPSRSHRSGEPRILARVPVSLLPRRACFRSSKSSEIARRSSRERGAKSRRRLRRQVWTAGRAPLDNGSAIVAEKRRSYFTRASHGNRYPFSLFFLVRGASCNWKRETFRFAPNKGDR